MDFAKYCAFIHGVQWSVCNWRFSKVFWRILYDLFVPIPALFKHAR